MNELQPNVATIDSREIAEMMGKQHSDVLKMLEGTSKIKGIIPVLTNESKITLVDYYIKSEYKDAKGEMRKCYLCTKMGCELLANKLTGEKGILFSARYVKAFNQMQGIIKNELPTHQPVLDAIDNRFNQYLPKVIGSKDIYVKEYTKTVKRELHIKKKDVDYENIMGIFTTTHNVTRLEDIPYSPEVIMGLVQLCREYMQVIYKKKQRHLF